MSMKGTRRRQFVAVGAMLLLSGAAALVGPTAVGAAAHTEYVGTQMGDNSGCASPGFTSVQAAVDAAPSGGQVYLCGAQSYTGPVVITSSITLTGDSAASITPPATLGGVPADRLPAQFTSKNLFRPNALVMVWGAGVDATISGLTLNGPFATTGCADNIYGVLVLAGGSADLIGDHITNIRSSNPGLLGCQYGVAVQAGREYWPTADYGAFLQEYFVGTVSMTMSTVSGYQKNGVTVDYTGSTGRISASSIIGDGRVDYIAQNGIQISRGATGSVVRSSVSGNAYTGPGYAYATGILVYGGCGDPLSTGVDVHNSEFTNNDIGIAFLNFDSTCSTAPSTATDNVAHNNSLTNDAVSNISGNTPTQGYQAGITDFGNGDTLHNNWIDGIGYAVQQSLAVVVYPVDTTGSLNVREHTNR